MTNRLRNRSEKVIYKDSVYELVIWWNMDDIRKCFCGMPPSLAYIRKGGKNFAYVNCYSNDVRNFTIEAFHLAMIPADWVVHFHNKDINTIPFTEILSNLPL